MPAPHDELAAEAIAARDKLVEQLRANELQAGLMTIWGYIARLNQYVDETAPFKLAKDPEQALFVRASEELPLGPHHRRGPRARR